MHKSILRSVPVLALLINALVIVVPNFNVSRMIIALIIMGGLCCLVYTRPSQGFWDKTYWYVLAAMLIGVALKPIPFEIGEFFDALKSFVQLGASGTDKTMLFVSFATLIITQLFMKNLRYKSGMIIVRFVALYIAMFTIGKYMVGIPEQFSVVLLAAVSVAAMSELYSVMLNDPKPATLRCFIFMIVYFLLTKLFANAAQQLYVLLTEKWLYSLVLLPLAGLAWAENYQLHTHGSNDLAIHNSVVWAMIAWVAFRVLTVVFPALWNPVVVFCLFPLAYGLCLLCTMKLPGLTWNTRFSIIGGVLMLVLVTLARTQLQTVFAYALLILVLVTTMCVCISSQKPFPAATRNTLLGIAGVILLATQRFLVTDQPKEMGIRILNAIIMCFLWGALCHRTESLQIKASPLYKEEFRPMRIFGWCLPVVLLIIVFINVFISK